jgi:hypothetical protein
VEELGQRLADAPVIISVSEQFPEDGRRGGHLVVARGYETEAVPTVHFRDPSRWGGANPRPAAAQPRSRFVLRPCDHLRAPGKAGGGMSDQVETKALPVDGRRIAVLGEMLELGDEAAKAHWDVGQMAGQYGADVVVAVGGDMAKQPLRRVVPDSLGGPMPVTRRQEGGRDEERRR